MISRFLTKPDLAAIFLASTSAFCLSFFVVSPAIAQFQLDRELANNCASLVLPEGVARNTYLDPKSGILHVAWFTGGHAHEVRLPYDPQRGFPGCNQSARAILAHVHAEYVRYISDSCQDFKAIIEGRKPLPVKNGERANIQGAIDFVAKYCR